MGTALERHAEWKEGNVSGKTVGNADFSQESSSSSEEGVKQVCRMLLSESLYR
jgi:hypothetical protein